MGSSDSDTQASAKRKLALRFIALFGIVSLFADLTYEGARSATGPFLLTLGASATVVGVVAGLGELLGYAVRLLSGYLADRLHRYWLLAGVGYAVGVLAVPLLALAGRWEVAASLVLLERFGKAVRSPGKDAMLSFATHQVGRGFGFAIHEAMDQIGAVAGPLLLAGALFVGRGYRWGFALLLVPAVLSLVTLAVTRLQFPDPRTLEDSSSEPEPAVSPSSHQASDGISKDFQRAFWLYLAFSALAVLGFAHFQIISFHMKAGRLMSDPQIPVAFAIAMGVDALVALGVGKLYDRVGLGALLALPVTSIPATLLTFGGSTVSAWIGIALWGAGMGVQETIMRAAVADMAPVGLRGTAYGLFNTAYGVAWFVGSAVMGMLYDRSVAAVIIFSVVAQVGALPLFLMMRRATGPRRISL